MKIEITPGPWEARQTEFGDWYVSAPLEGETCLRPQGECNRMSCECYDPTETGDEFTIKAISAVPEMLRVIVEIKEHFGYFSEWDLPIGFEERLDNALRKAGVME